VSALTELEIRPTAAMTATMSGVVLFLMVVCSIDNPARQGAAAR
jgi:hypothetical protein